MARACSGLELATVDGTVGAGIADGPAAGTRSGFYLAVDEPRALGRALHWARSNDLSRLSILADGHSADLARRAELLTSDGTPPGTVSVWEVVGADVEEAVPAPAEAPPELPEDHRRLASVISEAGARPVDDRGRLIAEVAGLEIGRVIDGEDGPRLDIGVGQADRELNQLVHGTNEPGDELRRVIRAVAEYRRAGSHHPLTRVGRERWLRSTLLDNPSPVGATMLEPLVPLRSRSGLNIDIPAAAAGRTVDGRPIVVVTMVGVDLDLIPEAADYRDRHDPDAELVLGMPERDLRLNVGLLDRLADARAVALEPPWR